MIPSLSKRCNKAHNLFKIHKEAPNPLEVIWRHSNNFQGLSIIFKSTLFAYLHLEWLIFTLCDVCMPCLDLDTHMFATMLLTHLCLDLHAHVLDIMCMVMPCLDLHVCMHVLCSYALCRHMLVCLYLCSSMFLCSHPHA